MKRICGAKGRLGAAAKVDGVTVCILNFDAIRFARLSERLFCSSIVGALRVLNLKGVWME